MSSQNFDSPTYTYITNALTGTTDGLTVNGIAAKSGAFTFLADDLVEIGHAMASGTDYYFAFRNTNSVLQKSASFDFGKLVDIRCKETIARTEQVSYLGYNGTSGSMDAVNATYYGVGLVPNHTFGLLNNSPLIKTLPFKSTAATQSNVAAGIANAGVRAFNGQPNRDVKFERVNSGALANALGTSAVSVVNQGVEVVFAEDMISLCPNGTILRFGSTGAGVDSACYIIASQDAGTTTTRIYTLDQPYQGTTNAAYAEGSIESVTEGDWGIKMTGVSVTDAKFNPITDTPYVVDFEVELGENFSTAAMTYTTGSNIGFGTYQLVSFDEAFSMFNVKDKQVNAYPSQPNHTFEAVSGEAYDLIEFEASDSKYSSASTGINPISKFRIRIWAADTACNDDYAIYKVALSTPTDLT